MKAAEAHKLSADEVKVETDRLRRKLFDLRTQTLTEKIEDTSQFRKTRRDLARLLTETNARARSESGGAKASKSAKSNRTAAATAGGKSGSKPAITSATKSATKRAGGK